MFWMNDECHQSALPPRFRAYSTQLRQGDAQVFRTTTTSFICCFGILLSALICRTKALADHTSLPSLRPAMRNVLIWDQDESGHMVNVKAAKSMNANVVNVAAVPHGVGTWIGSVKPLEAYKAGLKKAWKADLDELNRAGIAVWTSVNTTAFEPEVFKKYGMDPERYYSRNVKGEPQQHLGGAFSKEGKVFSSCPNNPDWMAVERDITLLFAENGFAGMFYDVGVLADDADMFCHCDYCKAKWKKHRIDEGLDPKTPLPV